MGSGQVVEFLSTKVKYEGLCAHDGGSHTRVALEYSPHVEVTSVLNNDWGCELDLNPRGLLFFTFGGRNYTSQQLYW